MSFQSLLEKQQLTECLLQIKEGKNMSWEQLAQALYQILDDIDTEDDHCKENNEAFRKFVMQHQARKNQFMASFDGQTVVRVNECVCHIYEMDDDELCKFYQNMSKSYRGPDGKRFETYWYDKALVEAEIKKRGIALSVLDKLKETWIPKRGDKFSKGDDYMEVVEYDTVKKVIHAKNLTRGGYEDIPLTETIQESKMTDWAYNELQMAGLFDKDSDYAGWLGEAVLELIENFSNAGHSGFSAGMALSIFDKLARWKPLTELTNNPSEWNDISETSGRKMYQSSRCPTCFSEDGGLTYYDLDEEAEAWTGGDGFTALKYDPSKRVMHTSKQKE